MSHIREKTLTTFGLNIYILFPKYNDHTYKDDIYTNDRIRTEA